LGSSGYGARREGASLSVESTTYPRTPISESPRLPWVSKYLPGAKERKEGAVFRIFISVAVESGYHT
jgi:hypothetical protein